jgi:DNA-binding LacI/PurR family transcriptional regulator
MISNQKTEEIERVIRRKSGRRVTSYDVARLAEVSQSAVSRAFDADSPISPEMRKKVKAAARTLGWQPNSIARSLQRQRADFIGVITSDLGSRWRAQQMACLIPALEDADYRPLIFQTRDEKDADTLIGQVMSYQGNAVILGAGLMSSRLADLCLKQGLLVISLNRWIERRGVVSIACDHLAGARMAAEHLVAGGCRKLLFVRGRDDTHASHEREAGFIETAKAGGVAFEIMNVGAFTREAGRQAGSAIGSMARRSRPDGIFAANDEIALGIIDHAYATGDYRVPDDFALVGFDDILDAAAPPYRLSTVAQPLQQTTAAVIGQLQHWIGRSAQRPGAESGMRVEPSLVVRRSSLSRGMQA